LLLAASAVFAADTPLPAFLAAPDSSPALAAVLGPPAVASTPQAVPADIDPSTCGPTHFFCQSCPQGGTRLCWEKICGTFVIINCNQCGECVPPPG
ncbi:MAG TPA: hypothetical protein VIH93_05400, partial [Thermoanaerobaculia bacterium]